MANIEFLPSSSTVKSGGGSTPTTFDLRNTTAAALSLVWVDSQGVERTYGTVQPGSTLTQGTFSGHVWAVKDNTGATLFKFVASDSGLITAAVSGPSFLANLLGTPGADLMRGTAADERFEPGAGNDTVEGGAGTDLVRLPGSSKDYDIKSGGSATTFLLNSAKYGNKTLSGVETVQFADTPYSPLDLTRLSPLLSYEVNTLRRTGDTANRVDLVFVAEGYTLAERQKFLDDAARMMETMLGDSNLRLNSPFSAYAGLFNVTAVFVPSAQSGIDEHLKGTQVDTAFDAITHGADGRLGYGDEGRVSFVLDRAVPSTGREMVVVLMNTAFYTNAGGASAWAAASNRLAYDVTLHEIGHSYAGLEDEYVDTVIGQGPLPATLDSVHVSLSPTVVPWQRWLGYQDELGTVGAYEGGYYRSTGVWRATPTSKMRQNDQPFSAPQKEAFIQQFYKHTGDYLSLRMDGTDGPRALVPDPLPVRLEWQAQGRSVGSGLQADAKLLINGSTAVLATPAAVRLSLSAEDASGMVRDPLILASSRQSESLDVLLGSAVNDRFAGTDKADVMMSGEGDDALMGLSGADALYGNGGRDTLWGGTGSDTLVGGAGVDFAAYDAPATSFSRLRTDQGWSVQDRSSADVDMLWGLERLSFKDRAVALDLGLNDNAGQAVLLVGAVLGRDLVRLKPEVMGAVINLFDQGLTLPVLAGAVMRLPIWAGTLTATNSSADIATYLLTRVHGRAPTATELQAAVRMMDQQTQGTLLATLATTDANIAQVDLVGLALTGLDYTPPPG